MIVYLANKTQFREDICANRIEEIVHASFKKALGKSVGPSELVSWKHSLTEMGKVLEDAGLPNNAGVAIEFNIPQTGKRVDFIVTGTRGGCTCGGFGGGLGGGLGGGCLPPCH